MILDQRAVAWEVEVFELARRNGWTTYAQDMRNRRQADPSAVFVRGAVVLAVFLRMSRRNAPPVEALIDRLGVEALLWTPADRRTIEQRLAA